MGSKDGKLWQTTGQQQAVASFPPEEGPKMVDILLIAGYAMILIAHIISIYMSS